MKNCTIIRNLLIALFCMNASVYAQSSYHPLAFGSLTPPNNYYKDYVGVTFSVSTPASIAGDYVYTTANDGTGSATAWGALITSPLINIPVIMAPTGFDSFACSPFPSGSMSGKIALVWRSDIGGSVVCEFSAKAIEAQNAGAVAVVIVNSDPGAGPVGMAGGASGSLVTIPVFMIGNSDGIAISATYHTTPAGTVKMTITPWGKGLQNDLGFVPAGTAGWHAGAIPAFQIPATETSAAPYKLLDGAFIANYGNLSAHHVKLNTNVSFTPAGGSATTVHTSTVNMTPAVFTTTDSIWALYSGTADLTGITGTGKIDINYTITSDSTDNYTGDNNYTQTVYVTDSVFCKGQYDIVNNRPVVTTWRKPGADRYIWGAPYYVKHGSCVAAKNIQFSMTNDMPPGSPMDGGTDEFHLFKWTPSSATDSTIDAIELDAVGYTSYTYTGSDVACGFFTTPQIVDGWGNPVQLQDNTWYITAVSPNPFSARFVGCDGRASSYPRAYGYKHVTGKHEMYNPLFPSDIIDLAPGTPGIGVPFFSYFGGGNGFNVDSVSYAQQKNGLTAALALRVTPYLYDAGVIDGTDTASCPGASIFLGTVLTTGTWSSSNTSVATVSGGIVTGVSGGTATISYTISGACGTSAATRIVTITPLPDAGSITGSSKVCIGSSVTLTDAAAGGTWNASNGNVSMAGGVVTGVSAGTVTVSYSVTNSCGSTSAIKDMTVYAPSTPIITMSGSTLSTDAWYVSYQWMVAGVPITGATSDTYIPISNGTYFVTVTDTNGCTSSSAAVNVVDVAVNDIQAYSNIGLSPNPTNSVIYVTGIGAANIRLYNMLGQLVRTADHTNSLSVADLPDGMYFARLLNDRGEVIFNDRILKGN